MKKNNTKIIISAFGFILLLTLTACSANQKVIEGKYVSIYDESTYLDFNKNGSVVSNMWTTIENGENIPIDYFRYSVDENNIITAIDTTEYEAQDTLNEYEIGIMYKEYICISWNGTLPTKYTNTVLTKEIMDVNTVLTYSFNEDKTYEYTVISNSEVVHTENGTYSINNNEIICTSEDGQISTFINIKDNAYCIEYVKE